jgi:hypothetical protein
MGHHPSQILRPNSEAKREGKAGLCLQRGETLIVFAFTGPMELGKSFFFLNTYLEE